MCPHANIISLVLGFSFFLALFILLKRKKRSLRETPKDSRPVTLVIIVNGDLNISTTVYPWSGFTPGGSLALTLTFSYSLNPSLKPLSYHPSKHFCLNKLHKKRL